MEIETKEKYIYQLIRNVYILHDTYHITHKDIKPGNVFIDDGNAKLGDFGMSTKNILSNKYEGTTAYMAPEIILSIKSQKNYFNQPTDVWSVGATIFVIIMEEALFPFKKHDLKDFILTSSLREIQDFVNNRTSQINNTDMSHVVPLLNKMLLVDPSIRISMQNAYKEIRLILPQQAKIQAKIRAEIK